MSLCSWYVCPHNDTYLVALPCTSFSSCFLFRQKNCLAQGFFTFYLRRYFHFFVRAFFVVASPFFSFCATGRTVRRRTVHVCLRHASDLHWISFSFRFFFFFFFSRQIGATPENEEKWNTFVARHIARPLDDVLAKARREDGSSAVSALLPPESVPGERERERERDGETRWTDGRTDKETNASAWADRQTDTHTHLRSHMWDENIVVCVRSPTSSSFSKGWAGFCVARFPREKRGASKQVRVSCVGGGGGGNYTSLTKALLAHTRVKLVAFSPRTTNIATSSSWRRQRGWCPSGQLRASGATQRSEDNTTTILMYQPAIFGGSSLPFPYSTSTTTTTFRHTKDGQDGSRGRRKQGNSTFGSSSTAMQLVRQANGKLAPFCFVRRLFTACMYSDHAAVARRKFCEKTLR